MGDEEIWMSLSNAVRGKNIRKELESRFQSSVVMECYARGINLAFDIFLMYPGEDKFVSESVEYFISCGIPVDCKEKCLVDATEVNLNLLQEAIVSGYINTVKTLLRLGASGIDYIDPFWFTCNSHFTQETARNSIICVALIDRVNLVGDSSRDSIPDNIKVFLEDWKKRYVASISLLNIAKITGNNIVDKNLLIKTAKMIWSEKIDIRTVEILYV